MYYFLVSLLFLFVTNNITAQNKRDYHWHFGKNQTADSGVQASQIDFNQAEIKPRLRQGGLEFDRNNASISDIEGNLLITTNGCAVANAEGNRMAGNDTLNNNLYLDQFWDGTSCRFGYPGKQDILILPDPAYDKGFYIIHKPVELLVEEEDPIQQLFLQHSYVDLALDNGLGMLTYTDSTTIESDFPFGYLSAISHSNGNDYWIIQPKNLSDTYHRILLDENGLHELDSIDIGNTLEGFNGGSRFSPDGTKYAIYNNVDKLQVFDFDRSTGLLSNPQFYTTENIEGFFTSLEFSPNSRFIYFMESDKNLWQIDLEDPDPQSSIVIIDEWNGTQDPFATTFFIAALAPDCNIYIRGGSSANSMHVIKEPNKKGQACDFIQNAIRFPLITSRGSFPNFPRFRVDEAEKCDEGLVSSIENISWEVKDLHLYPNPAKDIIQITIPDQDYGRVIIYDLQGQRVMDQEILFQGLSPNTLDVSSLASGSYLIEFIPHNTENNVFYQGRLQVVR